MRTTTEAALHAKNNCVNDKSERQRGRSEAKMPIGFLSWRFNFVVVFFGALLLIGMTRLTSLLPTKYYFSFSKLIVGDSTPLLIDPPSVSGKRLCALLETYRISEEHLGSNQVDCNIEVDKGGRTRVMKPAQKDAVYATALQADSATRNAVAQTIQQFMFQPKPAIELRQELMEAKSIDAVFDAIASFYTHQLTDPLGSKLTENYERLFSGKLNESERSEAVRANLRRLSAAEIDRVTRAHASFLAKLNAEFRRVEPRPITKTAVDKIVDSPYAGSSAISNLADFYTDQLHTVIKEQLRAAFASAGLTLTPRSDVRAIVFKEITAAGLRDYIVSIGFKVLPVVFFGFVLGAALGKSEIGSIGLAGAFAALLLSWPLIFSWDILVSFQWQKYRELFLVFYAVYALSFLLLARAGAAIGVGMKQLVSTRVQRADQSVDRVGIKEIVFTSFAGLAVNVAFYAGALAIPSIIGRA